MIWLSLILVIPYIILLLNYYNKLVRVKLFKTSSPPSNFVSVIVPCHNEEDNIENLLRSLSHQNYPADLFEVIVVNDNSTDKTFEIASRFTGIQNIRIINNEEEGKKPAIRTGISVCPGDLIITTDADCMMGENWIRTIASFYKENKPDMIICPVQLETGHGFFHRFQEIEFLSLQGITAGSALQGKAIMCNGANLAFSKDMYLRHTSELHDEINSGDDIFLLHSLKREKNSKILWLESKEATVTTGASVSLSSFIKQRKRWISKSSAYTDRDTIVTGMATFSIVLLQILLLVGSVFNHSLLWAFLLVFLLKSLPDFLIIRNTALRYGKTKLLRWFLPSQIIYPFYVMMVVISRK
jgi:cellulose synthase/poly-beta-1,6-N-acetylglucosamine synthase-like glycosyltransferase